MQLKRHNPEEKLAPKERRLRQAEKDPLLRMDPSEVDSYIEENIKTLDDAKIFLGRLLRGMIGIRAKTKQRKE